ncbi:MAG TPA: tetratricopeptide repeat protein, partial [Roseimicrobium sp.]|nr:tetratricopeptide repeat protein [Roseimicrobium sp.]
QGLSMLAAIYNRAGRYPDVVTLFEQSEDWGVPDVSRIYSQDAIREDFGRHFHGYSEPVGFVLANALIQSGRGEAARPIVTALLENLPGSDRGYELLAKLDGVAAVAKLDQLFGRDQFQERPLIWKAKLLLDAGKLAEAEEVVKKAVAIDPSDGEQGPDDRMRVYSVLADIREKRGDKKEAEFLRGAVKAIRLSEKADQFAIAGLLKRAIKMYQDSLNHFADAYCIQSRLAVQLSSMGMHSQAEAYYRKAYELMPDSFGRVESHCFGCEGVFAGERAQSIAEKVFTKLAKERPDKPQVHYLLGYLRAQQNRHEDAVPEFKRSVELDPEYLNAWSKMLQSVDHVHIPVKQRDRIVLEILRLDPLQQHGHVDVENVSDLRALWAASERAAQLMPKPQTKLFELAASAKKLEQAKKTPDSVRMMQAYGNIEEQMEMNLRGRSMVMILRQSFVQAAVQLIGKNSMSF